MKATTWVVVIAICMLFWGVVLYNIAVNVPQFKASSALDRPTNLSIREETMEVNYCSSCGAKIVWVKTTAGKNMPIDATVKLIMREQYDTRGASIGWKAISGHESHFATCPNADKFRRKG